MNMQRRVPGRRAQSELVLSPSARQAQDEEKFQPDEQDSHNTIHIDEIKWGSRLGEGAFGEVFRGEVAGCNVAIKVIKGARKGDMKIFSAFKKEIDLMRALRHPNIVEYLGACFAPEKLCIITEYYERGSLGAFLKTLEKQKKCLSTHFIIKTALNLAQGLAWLHRKNIIHRDLKPENVLLDHRQSGGVRICDFGVSHEKFKSHAFAIPNRGYNFYGTALYAAPEVCRAGGEMKYGVSADIYSLGVILVSMLKTGNPFDKGQLPAEDKLRERIAGGLRPSVPKDCAPDLASLIRSCFVEPGKRPSADKLCKKLQKMLQKRVQEETDMLLTASPALADLFKQKNQSIVTLKAEINVSNSTLKDEMKLMVEMRKQNAELKRENFSLQKNLRNCEKKLQNAMYKLKKKNPPGLK